MRNEYVPLKYSIMPHTVPYPVGRFSLRYSQSELMRNSKVLLFLSRSVCEVSSHLPDSGSRLHQVCPLAGLKVTSLRTTSDPICEGLSDGMVISVGVMALGL